LAIACLIGGTIVVHERRHHQAALAAIEHQIETLRLESSNTVREPTWAPAAMRALVGARAAASSPLVADHDPAAAKSAPDTPPPAPELEPAHMRETYDRVFAAESRDPAWSDEAKRTTSSKLPTYMPDGSTLRSIECRTSMCRLEIQHKNRDLYWKFVKAALMDSGGQFWSGAVSTLPVSEDPDDGSMVMYLAREGYSLPAVISPKVDNQARKGSQP